MEELLSDCRLVLIKQDGSDGIAYHPVKDKKSISIGSDPYCDIRINHEDVHRKHLMIYVDSNGKVNLFMRRSASCYSLAFLLFLL